MPYHAYIVDAVRTPIGKRKGALSEMHAADLGAAVCDGLVDRTKLPPAAVDDVIFGCVSQIGSQSGNLGRNVVLASKRLPISVPGVTVDRQCGSSQQAIHFAAQAVMSGTMDVVIAGGAETMSTVPIGSSVTDGAAAGRGIPFTADGIQEKWPGVMFSQFEGAEMVASEYKITRDEMDAAAAESHRRAAAAIDAGRFKNEIVVVPGKPDFTTDEGVRRGTTVEGLAKLRTLKEGGVVTAGSASQISDGAAAVMIVNDRALKKYGLRPRARIVSMAVAGDDPVIMLRGPIPATKAALAKMNLTASDIDVAEVNEAFGSVPLAWKKALNFPADKLNVNGGAMALGHPLGATGAKLMATLVNELERRGGRYGALAICEGGGTANATIIERCTQPAPLVVPKL